MRPQRDLSGAPALIARALLLLITALGLLNVLDAASYLGIIVYDPQILALILGVTVVYIFMKFPATARGAGTARVPWYDWIAITAALTTNLYVVAIFPTIAYGLDEITPERVALGGLALFLLFEAVRRVSGWALIIAVGAFLLYARYAEYFPGVLYARSPSWSRLLSFLYLDPSSLYGVPIGVIAGIVFAFVLFGNLLFASGGGQFLTDASMRVMGRYRGGPAKMSVLSSAAFGTMTGSAAANVVFTGMVSIPLMKRVGYPPAFAGAVEAVASSGGLLAPPVMGAAAFLMAEFLRVPYNDIALAALLPAVLYFLSVFVQVHLEADKLGLRGLDRAELPSLKGSVRTALLFFVPLVILIYGLFVRYLPPDDAVILAIGGLIVLIAVLASAKFRLSFFIQALEKSGRDLIEPLAISALAGLILGVVTLTGLGSTLSQALVLASGQSLLPLLLLTALASVVLGMGMPAVAIYVLLSILVAPALVDFGVAPIAAHLFIFYFGILSYVTPPMAFACFISGPMAGASPFRTGVEGMRLSIVAYVVPFFFIFHPALLLEGSWHEIVSATFSAFGGAACLAVVAAGYFARPLGWLERGLMALAGMMLLNAGLITDLIGTALAAGVLAWASRGRWRKDRTARQ